MDFRDRQLNNCRGMHLLESIFGHCVRYCVMWSCKNLLGLMVTHQFVRRLSAHKIAISRIDEN